ncbi:tRNA glutamyl-Q(34) synthetase GluQRS [Saccharospirillum sp. MSK14-1]|uniref:tRNA glutamyl-Q(34) synthetase GluQRS n=1 Tax=Saccharospirillum sp. MSK14-1 TaxID=1897632 RepID=UPI000D357AD2|nr:tRNA glutamyl-Q(34) synthetase GluQRS [Saccharospirillum sp. MSK14-1]PTY38627.1 tRNA glutamyl-Q(34) synthetase GluQRS [Saccharospirillum sp. MSK14-1]
MTNTAYRGRFAPSPTGPLHLGSLVAALVSYLDARERDGVWLVRIEDLDPPREQPGAADAILRSLNAHGLHWDENVRYQSQRGDAYLAALEYLAAADQLFWCRCSRKQLADHRVYPGTCRACRQPRDDAAIRWQVPNHRERFADRYQGEQSVDLATELGDVVLRRRDGPFAYQLAVTVDDIDQGITEVVRGIDLLDSTPWQRALFRCLGATPPHYAHFPVLIGANGQKLSKQNHAPALNDDQPSANLQQALRQLGLNIAVDTPLRMLTEAQQRWPQRRLKGRTDLTLKDTEDSNDTTGW